MSLKAWRFFKDFLKDGDSSKGSLPDCFHHCIAVPTATDFTVYTKPLHGNAIFDFVAHIRICGINTIKSQDLIHLASLDTLGVLEIIEPPDQSVPFPRVSDRLIRAWSEEADAFSNLKILRLLSLSLTDHSLKYVSKFDKLCFFEATGHYRDWQSRKTLAKETGWVLCDPHKAHASFIQLDNIDREDGAWDFGEGEATLLPLTGCIEHCKQKFVTVGQLGKLNWIYWLYDSLQQGTPLRIDEQKTKQLYSTGDAGDTNSTMYLKRPMASLILGKDGLGKEPKANITGSHPFHEKTYFWRYWLPDEKMVPRATSTSQITLVAEPGYTRLPRPQPSTDSAKRPSKDMTEARQKRRRNEGAGLLRGLLGDFGRGT